MTAGAGILHIEKPPEALVVSGGLFHGFQLWVNLPASQKWAAPRYQDIRAREVALVSSRDGGALVRVIAGDVAGHAGPWLHVQPDDPRPRVAQPGRPAVAAVAPRLQRPRLRHGGAGDRRTGRPPDRRRPAGRARRGRCDHGRRRPPTRRAGSPNLDVLLLGGRPIREPVAWMGPFVMNTREEVMQAMADYQAGRLGTIPAVHGAPTTLTESLSPKG